MSSGSHPEPRRRFRWRAALVAALATLTLAVVVTVLLSSQVVEKGRYTLIDEPTAGYLLGWARVGFLAGFPLALLNGLLVGAVGLVPGLARRAALRRVAASVVVLLTVGFSFQSLRDAGSAADETPEEPGKYPAAAELATPPELSASQGSAEQPNLVLLTIDTLRWDHLGYAGYSRPVSPHIDSLAQRGTVFEHGVAQVPATRGSMASMMTGVYPHVLFHDHQARAAATGELNAFVADGFHVLAERLSDAGYATAGFISNPYLKESNGFAQGFEHYDQSSGLYDGETSRDASAADLVDGAIDWLRSRDRDRPFFLWVHMLDPHHPYEPHEPGPWEETDAEWFQEIQARYAALSVHEMSEHMQRLASGETKPAERELDYLVGRYDAEILQTDRAVGRLVDSLEQQAGGFDETLVLLTSDHGEEFFDHGGLLHSHSLYDELVRVPFLVAGPGFEAGARARQARLLDVAPTFVHAAGLPTTALAGRPLQAASAAAEDTVDSLAFMSLNEVAYRTPTTKLLTSYSVRPFLCVTGRPYVDLKNLFRARYGKGRKASPVTTRLFDLAADPGEAAPIDDADRLLEAQCALQAELRRNPRLAVESSQTGGLSEEDKKNLEALGYVVD